MSTLTLLDRGVQALNERFTNKAASADLVCKLYTNNHTPAQSDTISSYTLCTLTGYAAVTLTGASWTGSLASDVWTAAYPAITFTFSAYAGGTTIYGALVTDGSGNAYMAGLLDTPFPVPAGGGSLVLTPGFATKQCP